MKPFDMVLEQYVSTVILVLMSIAAALVVTLSICYGSIGGVPP